MIKTLYTENDSKVGNLARQLRKFFAWSGRALCERKARVKKKNLLYGERSQKPIFGSSSVYLGLICIFAFCSSLAEAQNISGFWKYIDSQTKKTRCIISIYEYKNQYYGRIIGTFDPEGRMKENLYEPIDRAEKVHGSPFYCGMDLLWNLQEKGSKYKGKIVDPRSGKVYDAAVWVKNGNLIIRGEIFFFGKNAVWFPVREEDFPINFKKPEASRFIPVIPLKLF